MTKLIRMTRVRTATAAAAILSLALCWLPTTASAARVSEAAHVLAGAELDLVTFTNNDDGSVTLQFLGQRVTKFPPQRSGGVAEALAVTSSGAFVGDYVASGIAGLKFKVSGSGHVPQKIMAKLTCSVGDGQTRVWANERVTVSPVAGEWVVNALAMTREAGWDIAIVGDNTVDKDALFAQDLRRVTKIGLSIVPDGYDAQSYTIAEFRLVDANGIESENAILTLEEALMARFGVRTAAEVAAQDAAVDGDSDGVTDLGEILTDFDEDYENRTFAAQIVSSDENGTTIRWRCRAGRVYTVVRRQSLTGGGFVEVVSGLVAEETGYMTYTDTGAGEGQYFYKIKKNQ